jgi:cyclic pyranopterin phosphate synthase
VRPKGEVTTRQRDVGGKPALFRHAEVVGEIRLSPRSREAIRRGKVEKGDPLAAGGIAGIASMKRTSELLPHCHIVPLTRSEVTLRATLRGVQVISVAEAQGPTGVEMEALVGASVALLCVWDMVKYLEKDARGQYPRTSLGPVRVRRKTKGQGIPSEK